MTVDYTAEVVVGIICRPDLFILDRAPAGAVFLCNVPVPFYIKEVPVYRFSLSDQLGLFDNSCSRISMEGNNLPCLYNTTNYCF